METTDYVSYPIAVALKKAGFDWPCRDFYWTSDGVFKHTDALVHKNSEHCTTMVAAPTLAVAQKWLRDVFLLHVCANPAIPTRKWQFYIDDLNQQINPSDGELMTRWDDDMQEMADEHLYDSYEQALSVGIEAALELIEMKGE